MRVRVEQVELPGIGMRHDLVTEAGRRIGVVSHRTGQRHLVLFDRDDPDAATEQLDLTDDEAEALAGILGASLMLGQLAGLREQAAGLLTEQLTLPVDSPYVGRPLGDTRARTRTGVSIVAVLRDGGVIASPGPELVFAPGDVVVVVGTRRGLDAICRVLADG
ncbi:MAG: potassium transporter TrkA [Micromonosporaceae bacterium]|nr:potassium transporter TrkA [Micromonosporaceae bacterium]